MPLLMNGVIRCMVSVPTVDYRGTLLAFAGWYAAASIREHGPLIQGERT